MRLQQLSFDFTRQITSIPDHHHKMSWRVKKLARRHRLPISHAAIYASEMRLPAWEV